jgi:hypothetical protein
MPFPGLPRSRSPLSQPARSMTESVVPAHEGAEAIKITGAMSLSDVCHRCPESLSILCQMIKYFVPAAATNKLPTATRAHLAETAEVVEHRGYATVGALVAHEFRRECDRPVLFSVSPAMHVFSSSSRSRLRYGASGL